MANKQSAGTLSNRLRTQSTEVGDRGDLHELMNEAADALDAITSGKAVELAMRAMDEYANECGRLSREASRRIWGHPGVFIPEHHPSGSGFARAALGAVQSELNGGTR